MNRIIDTVGLNKFKQLLDGSTGKVDKVSGMGLSSNDYTTSEKEKLGELPTNADLTTILNSKQNTLYFDTVPTQNSTNPVESRGIYSAIKNVSDRIDEMEAEKATVSFSASSALLHASATTTTIILTASCSMNAHSIKIYEGAASTISNKTPIATISNSNGLQASINDLPGVNSRSVKYTAEFEVTEGSTKKTQEVTITVADYIFVGVGTAYNNVVWTQRPLRANASGDQFDLTTTEGQHIYVDVPSTMSNLSKMQLVSSFNTDLGIETVISTRNDVAGNTYKCYRNTEPRGAGTYKYKLV